MPWAPMTVSFAETAMVIATEDIFTVAVDTTAKNVSRVALAAPKSFDVAVTECAADTNVIRVVLIQKAGLKALLSPRTLHTEVLQ